ncbi:MAG: hypothetical protein ACI90V_007805 [Bacillariaceae sp.]|jgi:hypothetical protein
MKRRGMTLLDEKYDQKFTQVSSSIRNNIIDISNSADVVGAPRVEYVVLLDRTTCISKMQLQQASSNKIKTPFGFYEKIRC